MSLIRYPVNSKCVTNKLTETAKLSSEKGLPGGYMESTLRELQQSSFLDASITCLQFLGARETPHPV